MNARPAPDDSFCYAYDANGNLETKTAKVAGVCTGGVTTYIWNAQNQLIQIDFPDLTTAAYRYDGLGRRIEKDVDGVMTRYVYDGENILLEYDGTNALLARYSHGDQTDQPLAQERGGQSFFYQADHQGSVTQITDAAGFVANAYEYDSYGNIESAVEGVTSPFTYTGREQDPESGLYYYRARYYDPDSGRFLQEDPLGFASLDTNLYRYVFNNPVNLTDPTGLILGQCVGGSCEDLLSGIIGLFGGIIAPPRERGFYVCKARCSTQPTSCPPATCPPVVTGFGRDLTLRSARNAARRDANNKLSQAGLACSAKHCNYVCRSPKGDVIYS